MDIYSYLNSKDVAAHCRNLGHRFNTIEAAFIIDRCRRLSIRERHTAFRELMETMPDMMLPERVSYLVGDLDLFCCLEEKIRFEEAAIEDVCSTNGRYVYSYTLNDPVYKKDRRCSAVFSSYENAKRAAVEDSEDELTVIHAAEPDTGRVTECRLNRNGEIAEMDVPDGDFNDATTFFDDIWIYIPVPFERGDLVYMPVNDVVDCGLWSNIPMVLNNVDHWNRSEEFLEYRRTKSDSGDMTAFGYWPDSDGGFYYECCHAYQDLEYYRGELVVGSICGQSNVSDYRILKALSAYMKGMISEEVLLTANDLIKAEHRMKKAFPGWDFSKEGYIEAGIGDIWEKRELIRKYEKSKGEKA